MTDLKHVASEVEKLREDVDYLTALLEPGLATAGGASAALLTNFATPTTAGTATLLPPTAAHAWRLLTVREAAAAWASLTNWVDWLTDRYQLEDTLPVCWYRHGALVDELDALRAAWNGAYQDPNTRPTDPAHWHELLARALVRIHDWDRYGCAAGTHRDEIAATATPDACLEERDRHIQADIEARAAIQRPQSAEEGSPSCGNLA